MANFKTHLHLKNGEVALFLIFILSQMSTVLTKNCVKVDKCSCAMDDNSGTIDLSKIGRQAGTGPLIQDQNSGNLGDPYQYSFNPCFPFDEGDCSDVAGCQIDTSGGVWYDIGNADMVDFSYDESGKTLIGTYTAADGGSFFVLLFVYLIGGVLFNKVYRKESGRNVVPNVTLWGAMPGLVKEGFRFSFAKVRRAEYQPIK